MAATPSPNFNDAYLLAQDPAFQGRVRAAMIVYCNVVKGEAVTIPDGISFHQARARFATATLQNFSANLLATAQFFATCIATDSTILSDVTVAGATPLTSGNAATQSPLATDAHISNACAAQFNSFFAVS